MYEACVLHVFHTCKYKYMNYMCNRPKHYTCITQDMWHITLCKLQTLFGISSLSIHIKSAITAQTPYK